jgi:hypothetical protein
MAATIRQSKNAESASAGTTLASGSFTTDLVAGNYLLFVFAVPTISGVFTITPSKNSGTATLGAFVKLAQCFECIANQVAEMWYAPITGSGTCDILGTVSTSANTRRIYVAEISDSGAPYAWNYAPDEGNNPTLPGAIHVKGDFISGLALSVGIDLQSGVLMNVGSGWTGVGAIWSATAGGGYVQTRRVVGGNSISWTFANSGFDRNNSFAVVFPDQRGSTRTFSDTFNVESDTSLATHLPTGPNAGTGWQIGSAAISAIAATDVASETSSSNGNRVYMRDDLGSDVMTCQADFTTSYSTSGGFIFFGLMARSQNIGVAVSGFEFVFDFGLGTGTGGKWNIADGVNATNAAEEAWPGGTVTVLAKVFPKHAELWVNGALKVTHVYQASNPTPYSGNTRAGFMLGNFTGGASGVITCDNFTATGIDVAVPVKDGAQFKANRRRPGGLAWLLNPAEWW